MEICCPDRNNYLMMYLFMYLFQSWSYKPVITAEMFQRNPSWYVWLDGERPEWCVCVCTCIYIHTPTHSEHNHHKVNVSFTYKFQVTNIWLLKWPPSSSWTFSMIFLSLSWVFFPSFPLRSVSSLHSPLLPILCRLNVRGRGAVVRWERGKTRRRMLKTYVTTTTFEYNSSFKKIVF